MRPSGHNTRAPCAVEHDTLSGRGSNLTVHFLLLDPLCGTPYRLNFVAHILTARFATILKRFHFLSFILSYSAICSLHLSQLILL